MRSLRNWLVVVVLIIFGVKLYGVPYLRVTYQYRGTQSNKQINSASYYSVLGRRDAVAGEFSEGCPLVLFIPLERPMWEVVTESVNNWRSVK